MEKLRLLLLNLSIPLQMILQKVSIHERRASSKWVRQLEKELQPGDILIVRSEWHLSNRIIPGFYTHAALYVGHNNVIEAVDSGVKVTDLIDFVMKKDYVCHLKPNEISKEDRASACREAHTIVGLPYDIMFEYSPSKGKNKAFYCSEVIWYCYRNSPWNKIFTPRKVLGMDTIAPQDFKDAATKTTIVREY